MQEILVKLWCNRHFHNRDERVEATEVRVIEHRRRRGRLDLCEPCARELDALLGPWLAMADAEVAKPETRFKGGSREARLYRAGMRVWAVSVGRGGECRMVQTPAGKKNWRYTEEIETDYQQHLLSLFRVA